LINQIEEEEKAFSRATTKFAIDAAKVETEKAMLRASKIEALCTDLHDRLSRYYFALIINLSIPKYSYQVVASQVG
jgi:hypothetical protein